MISHLLYLWLVFWLLFIIFVVLSYFKKVLCSIHFHLAIFLFKFYKGVCNYDRKIIKSPWRNVMNYDEYYRTMIVTYLNVHSYLFLPRDKLEYWIYVEGYEDVLKKLLIQHFILKPRRFKEIKYISSKISGEVIVRIFPKVLEYVFRDRPLIIDQLREAKLSHVRNLVDTLFISNSIYVKMKINTTTEILASFWKQFEDYYSQKRREKNEKIQKFLYNRLPVCKDVCKNIADFLVME